MHFSKDSWHFRLATTYSSLPVNCEWIANSEGEKEHISYDGDLCTYAKYALSGAGVTVIITGIGLCASLILLYPFWWLAMWMMTGQWLTQFDYMVPAICSGIVYAIIAVVIIDACGWPEALNRAIISHNRKLARNKSVQKPDSFVVGVYRTLKDKLCFKLTVS